MFKKFKQKLEEFKEQTKEAVRKDLQNLPQGTIFAVYAECEYQKSTFKREEIRGIFSHDGNRFQFTNNSRQVVFSGNIIGAQINKRYQDVYLHTQGQKYEIDDITSIRKILPDAPTFAVDVGLNNGGDILTQSLLQYGATEQ